MHRSEGQSLVEMIVVIGIVVLLATGVIVGTSVTLSRAQDSALRSMAVQYAQEGIELTRAQRDAGWSAFSLLGSTTDIPPQSKQTTYCVGSDGVFTPANTSCSTPNINNQFTRNITLNLVNPADPTQAKMTIDVIVTWGDPTNANNQVELKTDLTQWR